MPVFGFLGFGEAGSSIATGLRRGGIDGIVAYDIAYQSSDLVQQRARQVGVELLRDPLSLPRRADVIISAVVCTESEAAARSVAPVLGAGRWFLDINSVSAGTKARTSDLIEQTGADYVDVAVMSNVSSNLAKLPMLTAGRRAGDVVGLFDPVPVNMTPVSEVPGEAARIKMFRSLFVKGLEALCLESMMACYPTGVQDQVLASMEVTFGKYTFPDLVKHLIGRHAVHGRRRGHELAEVAESLREVQVEPIMAEAGYRRMLWDVERGLQDRFEPGSDPDWMDVLAELDRLRREEPPG